MININNNDWYEHNKPRERTKKRLQQIADMGMVEVGLGQFGIPNIMSGLYIERVWSHTDEKFDDYMKWVQSMKDDKTVE